MSSPTLPATSAGAAKRMTCQNGKFHGMTASTTPSGWKSHARVLAFGGDVLGGEHRLGVLGVVAAGGGALGGLVPRGLTRLPISSVIRRA